MSKIDKHDKLVKEYNKTNVHHLINTPLLDSEYQVTNVPKLTSLKTSRLRSKSELVGNTPDIS